MIKNEDTLRFLQLLDESADNFIVVAFDDKDKSIRPHHKILPRDKISDNFELMNTENSFGIFVKRARAVFCEWDNVDETPNFPLKPSIIVNTSRGKYHYYWLTSTRDIEEWDATQTAIVKHYGGDKQARDASRVLRLPGYYHKPMALFPQPFGMATVKGSIFGAL